MENARDGKTKKVWYKRWRLWAIAAIVGIGVFNAGKEKISDMMFTPVPNVMGIGHSEAKTVLENAGFKVAEIEADASSVLRSSWNRTVKKGEIFKVNDETSPHYSDNKSYPIAKNKKVAIYYAKDDYIYEEPVKEQAVTEDKPAAETPEASVPKGAVEKDTVEWKQFIKEYEEWADGYIALVKKQKDNPTDMSILSDYTKALQKLAEWAEKADKVKVALENAPEALEYAAALARVALKVSGINN
jgi:tetratricopeptide (TPR) repeat protein